MPTITCPHCGARRNTPDEKLPRKPVNARCPECREIFKYEPVSAAAENLVRCESVRKISCPHCGLPREIPNHRQTNQRATATCRRCQRPFRLDQTTNRPATNEWPAPPQLNSIGRLLADSWELFCQRGWGLLAIYLFACLLIFTPALLATLFLPALIKQNQFLIWGCFAFGCAWTPHVVPRSRRDR